MLQKSSLGEQSEFFCKASQINVPDANISGLEQSERMASILAHLRAFLPHLRWVYAQQSDLHLPTGALLQQLDTVSNRSRTLAKVLSRLYQDLYPNQLGPGPEPVGGPTELPPTQTVFEQKIYGCLVLKTYRRFLSNVMGELNKSLKCSVCT